MQKVQEIFQRSDTRQLLPNDPLDVLQPWHLGEKLVQATRLDHTLDNGQGCYLRLLLEQFLDEAAEKADY